MSKAIETKKVLYTYTIYKYSISVPRLQPKKAGEIFTVMQTKSVNGCLFENIPIYFSLHIR